MIDIKEIKVGDIFSEESHYTVVDITGGQVTIRHLEGDSNTVIGTSYIQNFTKSADQYTETVQVGREDKKDGTPGIRTIFENIKSSECFTVNFTKQSKPKTKKKIEEEKLAQRQKATEVLASGLSKVPLQEALLKALQEVQDNPIQSFDEGENRTLRGFKVQFISRDGRYDCVDMDINRTDTESGIRPVNINTINSLIVNGVKYVVSK